MHSRSWRSWRGNSKRPSSSRRRRRARPVSSPSADGPEEPVAAARHDPALRDRLGLHRAPAAAGSRRRASRSHSSPRTPLPPHESLYSDRSSISANTAAGSIASTVRAPRNGGSGTAAAAHRRRRPARARRGSAAAPAPGASRSGDGLGPRARAITPRAARRRSAGPSPRGPRRRPCSRRRPARTAGRRPGTRSARPNARLMAAPPTSTGTRRPRVVELVQRRAASAATSTPAAPTARSASARSLDGLSMITFSGTCRPRSTTV